MTTANTFPKHASVLVETAGVLTVSKNRKQLTFQTGFPLLLGR